MTVCLYLPDGRVGLHVPAAPRSPTTTPSTPAASRFDVVEPFERLTSPTRARSCCSTTRSRWPTPRRRSPRTPTSACDGALEYTGATDMFGGESDKPREGGRGVRHGPLRAARRRQGHDPRRRRVVGGRRLRPPRPLVGTAVLAGALVLPLAHRQLRARLRLHGLPRRPTRRQRRARRLRVGGRPDHPVPRLRDHHRLAGRGHATTRASPPRSASGGRRSGRSPARCSTSSRCATAGPTRTGDSSSRASPRA